mmetsp:Transcript_30630/g.50588  ORF Transcript_30630/g.50588 Transcript_30630/m.50588 type:complete len:81 (+) Transcript_30630:157-399(+)|eukprot:CAMPEP_0119008838 /NCGR_PEP_ID=MMETSP1176-20130426/3977_1 /TAXON_ID=265551 /ORGANISM="Synedropsis recta cf, Strain CCMP1620" /LENGTH=80 /DNA_ID=CAMNT_0006961247 /DNA_START=150 /DNA_END=392 /DNA_ORIENTATION=-
MQATSTSARLFHLLLLGVLTGVGGWVLTYLFDWSPVAAYGIPFTVICQVNNAINLFALSASEEVADTKLNSPEKQKTRKE